MAAAGGQDAGVPRLAAAPAPGPPARWGGFQPAGKTLFSASGRLVSVIRRPLKMKRGGGSSLEGFSEQGLARLFLYRVGGDTQSSASVTQCHPSLPRVPLRGQR